jgi:hypothetical protein
MAVHPLIAPLDVDCDAAGSMMCGRARAGHAVHPMQQRIAAATPAGWVDAIVASVASDGWVSLVALEGGRALRAWTHERATLRPGEPVAVHELAELLAAGERRTSVVLR